MKLCYFPKDSYAGTYTHTYIHSLYIDRLLLLLLLIIARALGVSGRAALCAPASYCEHEERIL
jgi:hypothetical protein